jgi:PIN domain nuclease of toxin-antitoxin system
VIGPQISVLDASAFLAYIQGESGRIAVENALTYRAAMSSVNYAEVLARLSDSGDNADVIDRRLRREGEISSLLEVISLTREDAVLVADLRADTRQYGLSLGDRACLATAIRLGAVAITADRAWDSLSLGVIIQQIRE